MLVAFLVETAYSGYMKRFILVLLGVLVVGGGLGVWNNRVAIREWWEDRQKPVLPEAQGYAPPAASSTLPAIKPTSTRPTPTKPVVTPTSTQPTAPTAAPSSSTLPKEINLAVPFLSQAPKMDWSYPYQEACEEASAIMVDAFYRGQKSFTPDAGDKAILGLVEYEKNLFGYYEDTTAEETAKLIREYFGYKNVLVEPLESMDEVKEMVAKGRPVILPASGKDLGNPNFRNGGPPYHMLVVKGYTADGTWITNDPGTRRGADYIYANDVLWNAVHDWNGGNVRQGAKYMIVVMP
jgi:hypothetical protein